MEGTLTPHLALVLDHTSRPLRLFSAGQRETWQAAAIDTGADVGSWRQVEERDRELLLRFVMTFALGETVVGSELMPLIHACQFFEPGCYGSESRCFLAGQLADEARHAEFFSSWLQEVVIKCDGEGSLPRLPGNYLQGGLSDALRVLWEKPSVENCCHAVIQYHILTEGVLATTLFRELQRALLRVNILPALVAGIRRIRRDEARHVAFGRELLRTLACGRAPLQVGLVAEVEAATALVRETCESLFPGGLSDGRLGIDRHFVEMRLMRVLERTRENVAGLWKSPGKLEGSSLSRNWSQMVTRTQLY